MREFDFMKNRCRLLPFMALLMLGSVPGSGQSSCAARFLARVELRGEELSLADLLEPDTCPALLPTAAKVFLGKAPRNGSMRVLEKDQVQGLLDRALLQSGIPIKPLVSASIPERIEIQRRGQRSSCSEIARRIGIALADSTLAPECGGPERILRGAQFAVERRVWDPALQSWNFMVRCNDPADCVPFLLRVPGSTALGDPSPGAPQSISTRRILLRAGQTTTLEWAQNGIRMVLPAISLDAGGEGDVVRARVRSGRLLVTAKVTPEATLLRGE